MPVQTFYFILIALISDVVIKFHFKGLRSPLEP